MAKRNDDWEYCPYCAGSGTVEREGEEVLCSECNGSGIIQK